MRKIQASAQCDKSSGSEPAYLTILSCHGSFPTLLKYSVYLFQQGHYMQLLSCLSQQVVVFWFLQEPDTICLVSKCSESDIP